MQSSNAKIRTAPAPSAPALFNKPAWWDNPEEGTTEKASRCRVVVKAFVTGTLRGRMDGSVGNGRHIYTTRKGGTELWLFKDNPSIKVHICVAKKVNGAFVGNASAIMAMRQAGQRKINWTGPEQKIQSVLAEVMPMVPFRMFKENQLDLDSMVVIEKAPAEYLDVGRKRKGEHVRTHYAGAMLFKINVRPRSRGPRGYAEEFYLFDIDRNDLALKQFNPFLSKLARHCMSIADAYDSLKPQEVRDAERFMDGPCPRQGEWFFIPSRGEHKQSFGEAPRWMKDRRPIPANAILQSKGNRAHYVTELSEDGFVRGKVTHGGFEHEPIELKTWHKPVANTAVESFKVTGAID